MALVYCIMAKKINTWFVSVWFWLVTWLNWEMWLVDHGATGRVPLTSKFFWNSSSRASSSFCCHFCQTSCPSSSLPSSPVPLSPFTPPSADCKETKVLHQQLHCILKLYRTQTQPGLMPRLVWERDYCMSSVIWFANVDTRVHLIANKCFNEKVLLSWCQITALFSNCILSDGSMVAAWPVIVSSPDPTHAERVWWHPADSLGFIKNS